MEFHSFLFASLVILFLSKGVTCDEKDSQKNLQDLLREEGEKLKDKYSKIKTPDDIKPIKDWKEKCEEEQGAEVLEEIEKAPKEMVECFFKYVKLNKLQHEVNVSKERGNLDKVFKKYCGYRSEIVGCVDTMLNKTAVCLTQRQLVDVNITRKAIDAAIDFTCHDDGDRIALFMAEKGVECVREHQEGIRNCIVSKVPEIEANVDNPDSLDINELIINEEQCSKVLAIHECVVAETSKCDDPTPANILDALITQVLKATPCYSLRQREAAAVGGASSLGGFLRYSLAGIGPLFCSTFAQLGGLWVAVCSLTALVLQLLVALANGLTCQLLWVASAVAGAVVGGFNSLCGLLKHSLHLSELCSLSGVLVLVLGAVTAANILL